MGFDIYGLSPKGGMREYPAQDIENRDEVIKEYWEWQDTTLGAYFRNNVWWWRPLWQYVQEVVPNNRLKELGENNDGTVTEPEATEIAKVLNEELESGRTAKYEREYLWKLVQLPDVKCDICKGKGKRKDMPEQKHCNGCGGLGHERPWETHYPFSTDNVREFADFCWNSGGFEIR